MEFPRFFPGLAILDDLLGFAFVMIEFFVMVALTNMITGMCLDFCPTQKT